MGVGAISGIGSFSSYIGFQYKISSVYGNPKSLSKVEKIGEENYSGDAFAVVRKADSESLGAENKSSYKPVDYEALQSQMMIGSRFLTEGISFAEEY